LSLYFGNYTSIGYSENKPYDGIDAALRVLYKSEVNLCICTSKRSDFAEKILKLFDLRKYFKLACGGYVGIHKWKVTAFFGLKQVFQNF
jgi:phosphoglycolate phosphatase